MAQVIWKNRITLQFGRQLLQYPGTFSLRIVDFMRLVNLHTKNVDVELRVKKGDPGNDIVMGYV